jgi:hypothetical protein
MNRRVLFFVCAAVASALLIPVSPAEFRWVSEAVSATYIGLAVLAFLDAVDRR